MSLKRGIAIAAAAGTIATFGLTALTPKLANEAQEPGQQGGHAQQLTNEQLRQEGDAVGDSIYRDQFVPGIPEPREPLPKLPFRIVP